MTIRNLKDPRIFNSNADVSAWTFVQQFVPIVAAYHSFSVQAGDVLVMTAMEGSAIASPVKLARAPHYSAHFLRAYMGFASDHLGVYHFHESGTVRVYAPGSTYNEVAGALYRPTMSASSISPAARADEIDLSAPTLSLDIPSRLEWVMGAIYSEGSKTYDLTAGVSVEAGDLFVAALDAPDGPSVDASYFSGTATIGTFRMQQLTVASPGKRDVYSVPITAAGTLISSFGYAEGSSRSLIWGIFRFANPVL